MIPKDNEADLDDLPVDVRDRLTVSPIDTLAEALAITLRDTTPATSRLLWSRLCLGMRSVLLLVALGCGASARELPPSSAAPAPGPAAPFRVAIRVEHVAGADAWTVTYDLAEPARVVSFVRASYPFRAQWKLRAPVVLVRRDGDDQLEAPEPVTRIVIDIPTYHLMPEKDYQFLVGYSDGSSLLFSGQLDLGVPGARPSDNRFTFVPRTSERVILVGAVHDGPTTWQSDGEGTYVYFGTTTPEVTPELTAVVDAGTPAWLRDRTRTLFPKVAALYTQHAGQPLEFKPAVYLSYGITDRERSRSYGGNTLAGLVELDVRLGKALAGAPDAITIARVELTVAHEVAHFWNAQMFKNDGEQWLHEGGADAFALRSLHELGALSDADLRDALSTAVSGCMLGLGGRPLRESSAPGRTRNYYDCGLTIALFTEAATHGDIFQFWRQLFARAPKRHYDDALYQRLLEELGGRDAAALVRRMLEQPIADPGEIARALAARGVQLSEDDRAASSDYRQRARVLACLSIVAQDCDGAAALASGGNCRVVDAGRCHALSAGAEPVAVDGIALDKDPLAAYDRVAAACAGGASLQVSLGERTVALACRKPVARRAPFVVVH